MKTEQNNPYRKILENITGTSNLDEAKLSPILGKMETMNSLLEEFSKATTAQEVAELGLKIRNCQRECGPLLMDFLQQYGATIENVQNYFHNSNHLSKKEIDSIQALEQKLLQLEEKKSGSRRLRGSNKI